MGPPQPREAQLANGEQHRELLGSRGLIDRWGSSSGGSGC